MMLFIILLLLCIPSKSLTRENDLQLEQFHEISLRSSRGSLHDDDDDGSDEAFFKSIKNYTIYYPKNVIADVAVILRHEDDTGYLYSIDILNADVNGVKCTVNNQPCQKHCNMYVAEFTILNIVCSAAPGTVQIETIKNVATLSFNNCPQTFKNDKCLMDVSICFCDVLITDPMPISCRNSKASTCHEVRTSSMSSSIGTSATVGTTTESSTTELRTSTPWPSQFLDSYNVFFTGSHVNFLLESFYSPQTGRYIFELNVLQSTEESQIHMDDNLCNPTCTSYSSNKEISLISITTFGQVGHLKVQADDLRTNLILNNCQQTFEDRQCKTQFVPYWCICHSKDETHTTTDMCTLNIPLDVCPDHTDSPSLRLSSYHIAYGSDPFAGVFVDLLYHNGLYDFMFEIMPDMLVDVVVNGAVCNIQCETYAQEGTSVVVQIGPDTNLTFVSAMSACTIYYNECLQTLTPQCLTDMVYICLCQTFPSSMDLADVNSMCIAPQRFQTCDTTEYTSTTHLSSTMSTEITSTTRFSSTMSTPTPTNPLKTSTRQRTTKTSQRTTHTNPPTTTASTKPVMTSTTTEPITSTTIATTPTIPSLTNLTNSGVSLDNVTYVLSVTIEYTDNATTLQSTDISDVSTILTNSANLLGLPSADANLILQNMDNVLNAPEDQIEKSQSQDKFLSILPTLVMNTKAAEVQYLNGNNIGFSSGSVQQTSVNGLTDQGSSFQTLNNSNLPQSHQNSIVIHAGENGNLPEGTKAFFTIFRSKKFFNGKTSLRDYPTYTHSFMQTNELEDELESKCIRQLQLPLDSPVMSATVIQPDGYRVSKLATYNMSARLHLNTQNMLRPLHGHMIVSWWKTDVNKWATDDLCSTSSQDHLITATCNHLTDFALIIDSMVNDPVVCDSGLIDVGYVVNILSLTCLTIVIFIQFSDNIPICAAQRFMQRLKGPPLQKTDHMQMAHNIMLFLFYLCFLIFSDESISGKACNFIAALIYSLLLCSIILTIFQSLRTVVLFFPSSFHNVIAALMKPFVALTIGFVLPFLLCIILAATTPFFNRQDGFCWVRPDFIVYAIVIPVSILVINGIICTTLVAWRLFSAGFKFNRIGKAHDTHIKTKLLALFVLQFTMGMPWILQYPTLYHSDTTFWHYAFSIVLGSQGTILAVLYFYKNHRRWRESVRLSGRELRVRNVTSHTLQTRASS